MPVETDADRAVFVDPDDFGTTVAWWRSFDIEPVRFPAVFDDEYQLISAQLADVGVEGSSPQFQCRTVDMPSGAAQADRVEIGGKRYSAVEFKPDGTGMTIVRLQEEDC